MYDRRQKKSIQQKWAKVVEDIAQEPLDTHQLPRKVTVYISAPPMDGLVAARDHFHEYIKPILVAAALDWDAIEGRREGDVRAGVAERIRKLRKQRGEATTEPIEEGLEEEMAALRQRAGVREWSGPGGDIVVGRHTWKEYVRGLHEGWLGPLNTPTPAVAPIEVSAPPAERTQPTQGSTELAGETATPVSSDGASPTAADESPKTEQDTQAKEEQKTSKKKTQPAPFIATTAYHDATLSPNCPQALGPAAVIPFPHLLGFLNFPIRMYRFLNQRQAADVIGRETAAAVLGAYRPFAPPGEVPIAHDEDHSSTTWEQQRLLAHEEPEWHKKTHTREEGETRERVWLDDMVLDARIAERMRRFALNAEVEDRAQKVQLEPTPSWLWSLWPKEKKKGAWEGLSEE